jgi:predicted ArsR family transcriptional regulator
MRGDVSQGGGSLAAAAAPRLDLLKALGDNTRYAIFLELARSPRPLATVEVAEHLGLHPNTVRPHLERMREVGLLEVETDHRGGPGRPQHRYSTAADAPGLGLEPPAFPLLAAMLLRAAGLGGAGADDAVEAGREAGRALAAGRPVAAGAAREPDDEVPCVDALVAVLAQLGFDPARVDEVPSPGGGPGATTVAFAHCPYRDLAEANPALVCGLHRGLVEGFVDGWTGRPSGATAPGAPHPVVVAFGTVIDRNPCRADLAVVHSPHNPVGATSPEPPASHHRRNP